MNKFLTNIYTETNLYKKMSIKSEVVSQIIYGDSFKQLSSSKKWLKIRTKEDNYIGFIIKKNYPSYIKPTHKVNKIFSNIYKKSKNGKNIGKITFGSKIKSEGNKLNFVKFKRGWLKKQDLKPIIYENKNIFKNINMFKGTVYKWGGRSFKGIDCSAIIQIFLNFNNKFCPRDTKDQIQFFKKNIKLTNIKKNDIIYWKGHVAVAISKTQLIHAYGPKKKVIQGNILKTIKLIKETAGLNVLAIKRV